MEAARIVPDADNERDGTGNGILLYRNHHALFDKQKWSIYLTHLEIIPESDFELLSLLQVMRSNIRHLKHSPNKEALEWRWNKFNKDLVRFSNTHPTHPVILSAIKSYRNLSTSFLN